MPLSNPDYRNSYPDSLIKKMWEKMDEVDVKTFKILIENDNLTSIHIIGGGMAVRNFLRNQPECKDWNDHDFDNNWISMIECAINYGDINTETNKP